MPPAPPHQSLLLGKPAESPGDTWRALQRPGPQGKQCQPPASSHVHEPSEEKITQPHLDLQRAAAPADGWAVTSRDPEPKPAAQHSWIPALRNSEIISEC